MKARAELDIARHLKSIETLKAELLGGVADLYRQMKDAGDDVIAGHLAQVVVTAYVLGRRLGVEFDRMDAVIRAAVQAGVEGPHDCEEWYGDFSALSHHLDS